MAPGDLGIATVVVASASLEVYLLSFCILLILTITFLALCTDCRKCSFDLTKRAKQERTSLIIVQVVNVNQARQSPWINNITEDEKDDLSEPTKTVNGVMKETSKERSPSVNVNAGKVNVIPSKKLDSGTEVALSSSNQYPSRPEHMYESTKGFSKEAINPYPSVGASGEDYFEEPGYQTLEELTSDSSSASWWQDAALSVPSTPSEVVGEGLENMRPNDIYARISKKSKSGSQKRHQPEEEALEEEEIPPPVPDKSSE